MDTELEPTCPAMRHISQLIKNNDAEMLNLYLRDIPLKTALKADVAISRLLTVYADSVAALHEQNTLLRLQAPQARCIYGVDPALLKEAEEACDHLARRLTNLVGELQDFIGVDLGTEDPDEQAVTYLKRRNRDID